MMGWGVGAASTAAVRWKSALLRVSDHGPLLEREEGSCDALDCALVHFSRRLDSGDVADAGWLGEERHQRTGKGDAQPGLSCAVQRHTGDSQVCGMKHLSWSSSWSEKNIESSAT